jgi:hypothetical protein
MPKTAPRNPAAPATRVRRRFSTTTPRAKRISTKSVEIPSALSKGRARHSVRAVDRVRTNGRQVVREPTVAQAACLLCRRLAVGKPYEVQRPPLRRSPSELVVHGMNLRCQRTPHHPLLEQNAECSLTFGKLKKFWQIATPCPLNHPLLVLNRDSYL